MVDQPGHLDVAHWCVDSLAWEEAASAVLTAVYARVSAGTGTAPSRCSTPGRLPAIEGPPLGAWLLKEGLGR